MSTTNKFRVSFDFSRAVDSFHSTEAAAFKRVLEMLPDFKHERIGSEPRVEVQTASGKWKQAKLGD